MKSTPELEAEMLRLHYAEHWPVGTIATSSPHTRIRSCATRSRRCARDVADPGAACRSVSPVHRRDARALSQAASARAASAESIDPTWHAAARAPS